MKCSEFMIGDWIHYNHQFPMQVRIICEDYLYADLEGKEGDNRKFDDKSEPPYPIPLTEEIIEKNMLNSNGIFCNKAESFEDAQERDTYEIHISGYCIGINGFIWYVHELQHILRLAGLKEMADNFKI